MVHNQTPDSSTLPDASTPVYAEPQLTEELLERFDSFAQKVARHDGVSAFSEQTRIELSKALHESTLTPPRFFIAEDEGTLAAVFVALTPTNDEDTGVIEAAVAPEYRGRGAGSAFFDHAVRQLGNDATRHRLWVHGTATDTGIESPAHTFATLHGFKPVRVLYKMVLPLDAQTREDLVERSDARTLPENLRMRTFTSVDEFPWLRVNAAAFAHHPEQGKLTLADLRERTGSSWFRPEGFFIASEVDDDSAIAAFTWTKIRTGQEQGKLSPSGEIYVVGVNPQAQGCGLGRTLTLRALGMRMASRCAPLTCTWTPIMTPPMPSTLPWALVWRRLIACTLPSSKMSLPHSFCTQSLACFFTTYPRSERQVQYGTRPQWPE